MSIFLVRPSNSEKEAFRIKLSAASLLGLRLKSGDLCAITKQEPLSDAQVSSTDGASDSQQWSGRAVNAKFALAWEAQGTGMKDSIVQMSKSLQDLYGFRLGDKVIIERSSQSLVDAGIVRLRNLSGSGDVDKLKFWEYYARLTVRGMHELVARNQILSFKVAAESVQLAIEDPGANGMDIARVVENTRFELSTTQSQVADVKFTGVNLGGLQRQIQEMQKLVSRLLRPKISPLYPPVQGILIYGAKGVGKSYFINELASSGWQSRVNWMPGTKVTPSSIPTILVVDQLDLPVPRSGSKTILRELDQLFSTIKGLPWMIVAEAKHPNDVDPHLRSEGKFSVEIELPIPSALQRKEILDAMTQHDKDSISDEILQQMSERTHGYVAADLKALLRRTLELASEEEDPSTLVNGTNIDKVVSDNTPSPHPTKFHPTTAHLATALTQIRPSALQEIFLETPSTRYTDIGGMHALKRALHNAVSRPLTHSRQMAALGLPPKKGVLLYGPPGCSKTLLVRALANEAKLNFLAVKGAELISMYVGESERATREVFRKARAASPSIIFFDEIDAIASNRSSSSSSSSSGKGGELNVLTTLLNEMDGFEPLNNVFVVAATNKPAAIDPALLRPGRFDNVLYVGPPDEETRKEIFLTRFLRGGYRADPHDSQHPHTHAHAPAKGEEPSDKGTAEVLNEKQTQPPPLPPPPTTGIEDTSEEQQRKKVLAVHASSFAALTDGFSGAEVVAICHAAAERALDEEREWFGREDVLAGIAGQGRSITREMLEGFEAWRGERMG